jgi:hypothetical protein
MSDSISNKTTFLRAFNTLFFDFLNDIISVTPENTEIIASKCAVETIKKANPSILIKVWYQHLYLPYKEAIEQGNISVIYDANYHNDLAKLHTSKEIIDIIDKIREPIKTMSTRNKEISMEFIQKLSKLSCLYAS